MAPRAEHFSPCLKWSENPLKSSQRPQRNEVTVPPRTQHRTVLHFTFYFLPFMPLRSQFRFMSTTQATEYEIFCKRLLHALYFPGYRTSSGFCHLIIWRFFFKLFKAVTASGNQSQVGATLGEPWAPPWPCGVRTCCPRVTLVAL